MLLAAPLARTFVTRSEDGSPSGFALTYLIRAGSQWSSAQAYYKGSLAALVVHPDHQHRGVGSALHARALEHLTDAVQQSFKLATPQPEKSQIQVGSIFPRIFPGVPDSPAFADTRKWFEGRGWKFGEKNSIDLYQPLRPGKREDLEQVMSKAKNAGFRFGEPEDKDIEALYQLQKDNFESYTVCTTLSLGQCGLMIGLTWDRAGQTCFPSSLTPVESGISMSRGTKRAE